MRASVRWSCWRYSWCCFQSQRNAYCLCVGRQNCMFVVAVVIVVIVAVVAVVVYSVLLIVVTVLLLACRCCSFPYSFFSAIANAVKSETNSMFILCNSKSKQKNKHKQKIRVWRRNGRCLFVLVGHERVVLCVALSSLHANKQFVCSGSRDCTVRVWDLDNGQCLQVIRGLVFCYLLVCLWICCFVVVCLFVSSLF